MTTQANQCISKYVRIDSHGFCCMYSLFLSFLVRHKTVAWFQLTIVLWNPIGFYAKHFSFLKIFRFEQYATNFGGGFNPSTGQFRVHTSGLYFLRTSSTADGMLVKFTAVKTIRHTLYPNLYFLVDFSFEHEFWKTLSTKLKRPWV